jgi:hypothetical protein
MIDVWYFFLTWRGGAPQRCVSTTAPCLWQSGHCLSQGGISAHLKSPFCHWLRYIGFGQNYVRFYVLLLEVLVSLAQKMSPSSICRHSRWPNPALWACRPCSAYCTVTSILTKNVISCKLLYQRYLVSFGLPYLSKNYSPLKKYLLWRYLIFTTVNETFEIKNRQKGRSNFLWRPATH